MVSPLRYHPLEMWKVGGKMKDKGEEIKQLVKYLNGAKSITKSFMNVNVYYIKETGELYIDDSETDKQLAVFSVKKG